jgi:hypothetical protein
MRNRGVQAMLYPYIDCLNQNKFAQWEIIFHHLVTHGSQKITRVFKHGEQGLNELEAGCLMKVKCDTMLPTMMKTLMTMDFLRKMTHYSHQMC